MSMSSSPRQRERRGFRGSCCAIWRLFLNGINHQLDLIRAAGLNPQTEQEETERELVLTIRIPKSVSGR